LTRSFKKLVQRHVAADPAYSEALLREGIDTMLAGDIDTGKTILRDYIKATIGVKRSACLEGINRSKPARFHVARNVRGQADICVGHNSLIRPPSSPLTKSGFVDSV
jgi:hypothetical protein